MCVAMRIDERSSDYCIRVYTYLTLSKALSLAKDDVPHQTISNWAMASLGQDITSMRQ